jgi:hypothetical protein
VAAQEMAHEVRGELQRLPEPSRPPHVAGPDAIDAFDRWARAFIAEHAGTAGGGDQAPSVVYTVHRLLVGGWIATVTEVGDQPRPLALSDGPELRPDRRAHRRLREDEMGAAADVIETMFTDMRTRDLERSQGSLVRHRTAEADAQGPVRDVHARFPPAVVREPPRQRHPSGLKLERAAEIGGFDKRSS